MWYYYHELAVSYYRKGLSHKGTGDISLSHECYRQAEDSYCILFDKMRVYHLADDYGYHYHLGVIYIEWEKYPEAIRELNYSIENNDNAKVDIIRAKEGKHFLPHLEIKWLIVFLFLENSHTNRQVSISSWRAKKVKKKNRCIFFIWRYPTFIN